ncbi:MAG: hypothetical protein IAE82_02070 [Opitutaceae bacterium]|nr:hypothetical protein [Opitutaceae bacterium]
MAEVKHPPGGRAALFRLEFGGANGWGHLVRSGALAAELRARGWRCGLWTSSATEGLPSELREPFDHVVAFERPAGPPRGWDWLVVDHYGTTDAELGAWRCVFVGRILAIDDEAKRHLVSADLVLNARLGLDASCYAAGVATLLGARYALLRSGLRSPVAPEWQPPADVESVLVMLGGTDPAGLTSTVLEALADVDAARIAPVVVQPGGEQPAALRLFPRAVWLGQVNARELAGWAGVCRFAVSAAGGTLYELAMLRLPFVSVVVAENQARFSAEMEARWRMPRVGVGSGLRKDLATAVRRLRGDLGNARAALSGVDGRGAERVADAMVQGVG